VLFSVDENEDKADKVSPNPTRSRFMVLLFERLFQPLKIGPVTIKNRIQILPHATLYDMKKLASYCTARAEGGAGLIEVSMVTPVEDIGEFPQGQVDAWPYKGYDPRIVDYYEELTTGVHKFGAKVFFQLAMAGGNRGAHRSISPFPGGPSRVTARQLTESEVEDIVRAHGVASKYMQMGGADGVDLHASHGMFLEEFYSKATNRRTDRYGGSLDNRLRIITEIIEEIQKSTHDEFAVGMRLNADEKFAAGNDLAEQIEIAKKLDGRLDFLNVDIGFENQFTHVSIAPLYAPFGFQIPAAAKIKQVLSTTVMGATGRIVDPGLAEKVLSEGSADMVGMTRALIADPELPNKLRDGRLDEIRSCIGDNQMCIGNVERGQMMRCTVNPTVGREGELARLWERAPKKKRVLVIGGGLAGMEVARTCAMRGHEVFLFEKENQLGGQMNLAAALPKRGDLISISRWYEKEIKRLGVEVRLNSEIQENEELVNFVLSETLAECIVLSTGSLPIRNGAQSFDYQEIKGHEYAVTGDDVLGGRAKFGKNVVILDESAFIQGLGLAEKLARAGSTVELVTRDTAPGNELHWSLQLPYVYENAMRAGVRFTPNSFVREITKTQVVLYNIFTGEETIRSPVDTAVLETGRIPNDLLWTLISSKVRESYIVGDCNIAGRQIGEVISDAFDIARKI